MQVWTNCRLYNAEGSDISRACKRLEKHALAAWKEHELSRKHGSGSEHVSRDFVPAILHDYMHGSMHPSPLCKEVTQ